MGIVLYPEVTDVPLTMKGLVTEHGFAGTRPLQEKTGVEFVGHANPTMYLNHVVGHVVQTLTHLTLG